MSKMMAAALLASALALTATPAHNAGTANTDDTARFLAGQLRRGVELMNCPVYLQRWISQEADHSFGPVHNFFLLALAGLVVPNLGRRHVDRRHGGATRRIAQLGVPPEVADQNHLVDRSHGSLR